MLYLFLSCSQGKTLKGIKTLRHLGQANVHRLSSLPNHPDNFVRDAHWHVPVEPGSDRQNPEQQGGLEFTVYNLQSAIALDTPLFLLCTHAVETGCNALLGSSLSREDGNGSVEVGGDLHLG